MAKNTKVASPKTPSKFVCLVFLISLFISSHSFAYTDQIVIETPNMAKTVYDIRVHALIRHLYEDKRLIDPLAADWMGKFFEDERTNFVQQYLAQNYVVENDLNLKPTPAEVQQAVRAIEQPFATKTDKAKALSVLDITENDIQQWAMNRLIFERFVTNTIQNRVIITEEKMNNHYQIMKSKKFGDKPYEDVKSKVQEDLLQTLLKEEFEKWIDQEKRREKMILKVVAAQ